MMNPYTVDGDVLSMRPPRPPGPSMIEICAIIATIICFLLAPLLTHAGPKDRVAIAEAAVWTAQNQFPQGTNDFLESGPQESVASAVPNEESESKSNPIDDSPRPMRIEVRGEKSSAPAAVLCRVHIANGDWCIPCNNQKSHNGAGDETIAFEYTTDPSPSGIVPCTTFVSSDGRTHLLSGYHTTQQVYEAVQRNRPATASTVIASAGPAGAIHGRPQIQAVLAWWRTNIGETVKVEFRWDRSGAQSFPLLAKSNWSWEAVCGKFGHVSLSAVGSKLPVESFGFSYRIVDEYPVIDLDPIAMKWLINELASKTEPENVNAATPAGWGPMTWLTAVQIIRGVYSLLNPTCDLQLGGNVSCVAMLQGETLSVTFQQCPSIKLVALFTFQLRVDRVEVTEKSVRVVFGGSRLVKERTFVVQ